MAELSGTSLKVLQYLQWNGDKRSASEIAADLGIAKGSVEGALTNLTKRKLGARVCVESREDKIFILSNEGRDYVV